MCIMMCTFWPFVLEMVSLSIYSFNFHFFNFQIVYSDWLLLSDLFSLSHHPLKAPFGGRLLCCHMSARNNSTQTRRPLDLTCWSRAVIVIHVCPFIQSVVPTMSCWGCYKWTNILFINKIIFFRSKWGAAVINESHSWTA